MNTFLMIQRPPKSTPVQPQPVHRPIYFKLAVIIGAMALLFFGFLGGQAFERIHIRHYMSWQDNYQRNFFGGRGFDEHFDRRGFVPPPLQAHELLGKILSVNDNQITVQDVSGMEQFVFITNSTVIRRDGSTASKNDLQIDTQIAVFGRPNGQGQIEAQLIRILDANAQQ